MAVTHARRLVTSRMLGMRAKLRWRRSLTPTFSHAPAAAKGGECSLNNQLPSGLEGLQSRSAIRPDDDLKHEASDLLEPAIKLRVRKTARQEDMTQSCQRIRMRNYAKSWL